MCVYNFDFFTGINVKSMNRLKKQKKSFCAVLNNFFTKNR